MAAPFARPRLPRSAGTSGFRPPTAPTPPPPAARPRGDRRRGAACRSAARGCASRSAGRGVARATPRAPAGGGGGGGGGEAGQGLGAVAVDADVAEGGGAGADRGAGEVERVAGEIGHDFDEIARGEFFIGQEGAGQRRHFGGGG